MLTIDRVCKSFGSLSVLKDVSLTVGDGEIVALIGPSGCGKTTLLDIISGLSQPDSGTVIGGENISYMFQSARLLPWRDLQIIIPISFPAVWQSGAPWHGRFIIKEPTC